MKTIYNIKTYDKYKDSGIEWIGEIPQEWKLVKTSRLFRNTKEIVGQKSSITERLALTLNGVIKRNKDDAEGLQPEQFDSYQYLRKNQLVFKLIDLENVNTSRVGICPFDEGMVSPAYIVLQNKSDDNRYYHYYFLSLWYNEIFNHLGGDGVRSALNAKDLLNIPTFVLSKEMQQQIADYLDKKCGEVDRIVEVQKLIIEKLKEYKQSVITEAVTKGLDKNAPLKDSGIEWIGKIPQDWKVLKLKYISDFNQEVLSENTDKNKVINYIEIGSVTNEKGISDYQTLTFENAPSRARRIVRNGDTILSTVRTYLKAIAYIDNHYNNFICSTGFAVFTPNKNILPKFLFHALHSEWFVSTVEANSVGISYPAINTTNIINYKLAIPSVKEQEQILCYLDNKCSEIDKAISEKEVLIEKLTEYKKSLIYECVTGKIRVSERHCEEYK